MLVVLRRTFLSLLLAGGMLAIAPSASNAQSAKSATYVELAGNGILYSLNYDYRFNEDITGRLGVMRAGAGGVSITSIPVMGNYLVGSGSHRFELGVGPNIIIVDADTPGDDFQGIDDNAVAGTATIGYRYQPMDGGFTFRVGLTPSFGAFGILPWAGLSLGYAF